MSGTFILYEHTDYGGNQLEINLDNHTKDGLHAFTGMAIHDELSSLSWDLDNDVIVTLYEHTDGTGRVYNFGRGSGADSSTHGDDDFKDCVSSWRWTTVDNDISVIEAFNRIATNGKKFTFPGAGININGGHFQGVGHIDNQTLAISASSDHTGLVFIFEWPAVIGQGEGARINSIEVDTSPYDHAGGIQVFENFLVVGVEDFGGKKKSRVKFYDVQDPRNEVALDYLTVERESTEEKRKTAGAVGLIKFADEYLLIVGSWNSDTIDFYRATRPDLLDPVCRFDLFASWEKSAVDNYNEWIDRNWEGYQSLNLVSFNDTELYLIGGHETSIIAGKDWIDLYRIDISTSGSNSIARLVKVGKRHLTCHDGTSFRYAGGIIIDGNNLHAVATESDPHERTAVNIFEGPGGVGELSINARYIVNKRSLETHSIAAPCKWVKYMAKKNIRLANDDNRPNGAHWCDYCFPEKADG